MDSSLIISRILTLIRRDLHCAQPCLDFEWNARDGIGKKRRPGLGCSQTGNLGHEAQGYWKLWLALVARGDKKQIIGSSKARARIELQGRGVFCVSLLITGGDN